MGGRTVTFGAVGDIEFDRACGEAMQANGLDWPFEKMRPHLERADVLFGNMESVLLPVAENRNWVDEVFAAVQENWARQAARIDPLHRPQFAMMSRKKGEQRPRDATRGL